jgi:cytochrome P450
VSPADSLAEAARLGERSFYVDDPHSVYARLRSEAPVWWYEEGNFWALTKHADVRSVAARPSVWSSAHGSFLPDAKYPEKVRSREVDDSSLSFGSDPPHHTQYRRLISAVFTPRIVGQVEPMVRRVVTTALDGIEPGAIVDVVDAMSVPTSINVIAALLGVPVSDWADFTRWSDALSGHLDAIPGTDEEERLASQVLEMETYLLAQLDFRLQHPQDDWLTAIATMCVDGEPTSAAFQLTFARALLVAVRSASRLGAKSPTAHSMLMIRKPAHVRPWARWIDSKSRESRVVSRFKLNMTSIRSRASGATAPSSTSRCRMSRRLSSRSRS